MTLRLTVEYRAPELRRFLGQLIGSAKDVPALLRVMGRVALRDSKERFAEQGPGWPPRAQSTLEKLEGQQEAAAEHARSRAERVVRRKLRSEHRRALRKFSPEAAERRYEILKEFERYVAGGRRDVSLVDDAAISKTLEKTEARLGRAETKARGRMLGRLGGANKLTLEEKAAVIRNVAKNKNGQSFSRVLNEGGSVGHGASVPARPFLLVSQELMDRLPQAVLDHLMKPVMRGEKAVRR